MTNSPTRLLDLLAQLSLERKVELLTGQDFWSTIALPEIGLRSMVLSDGPSGVRGPRWDERDPSLNLPSASALSASWDTNIAYRYGGVSAGEARRKGVDVVLGPTINIQRSPYGGRHFEAFSEDPLLTDVLAAAYVAGVQEQCVAATPKHYIANDFESDRFTADVVVDERTLREVYLAAFESSITESNAWAVMSAYNSVNGATMTENDLLETPLNSEWGFDGVVVSDWTAVRSLASALTSQDLVMPGPNGPWGQLLVDAVRSGEIAEEVIDRKVLRLLQLATRVGALGDSEPEKEVAIPEDGAAFAREAAAEGFVLASNNGLLPLAPDSVKRIALIGHGMKYPRTQGGGSATVIPEQVSTVLEGVSERYPQAEIDFMEGIVLSDGVTSFPLSETTNPVTGEPGVHVRFRDANGTEIYSEERFSSELVYFGGDAPIRETSIFEFSTIWTPSTSGETRVGFAAVGRGRVYLDNELVVEATAIPAGDDLGAAFLAPPTISALAAVKAFHPVRVRVELDVSNDGPLTGALSARFGTEALDQNEDEIIKRASAAAAAADVAIVIVGTTSKVESEGYDRTSLALPGRQDDLAEAVTKANAKTVVLVNSGSPVLLPWSDDAAAILLTWFGGQEYGNAVADVISGHREPGGRLPTTWPRREEDLPVYDVTPRDGIVRYDETIHVGYRAWLKAGRDPLYWFGHGLGYTTWKLDGATRSVTSETGLVVSGRLTNTGARSGKTVVQVFASRPVSTIDRPVRWLVGFASVRADAGEIVEFSIPVAARRFAHWSKGWNIEPGQYALHIGFSAINTPVEVTYDA